MVLNMLSFLFDVVAMENALLLAVSGSMLLLLQCYNKSVRKLMFYKKLAQSPDNYFTIKSVLNVNQDGKTKPLGTFSIYFFILNIFPINLG